VLPRLLDLLANNYYHEGVNLLMSLGHRRQGAAD